ncbi:hypothetical protein HSX11_11695 [Oxalobacteraceae bacterium]|nr:hypothetical protein [Oxalobacteraceae bacterium]
MGLFSLFKKPGAPEAPEPPAAAKAPKTPDTPPAARAAAPPRPAANGETERQSEAERQHEAARQRDIARATAMKIDAIESAMEFDIFNTPEPAWGSRPARPPRPPSPAASSDAPTLPLLEQNTTELLGSDDARPGAAMPDTAPVVEEVAILYANGQSVVAEQMLTASLAGGGPKDPTVWWMLFDLYQVTGQQDRFDNLAIDYASTFETSPPSWAAPAAQETAAPAWAGLIPAEAFTGILDETIAPQTGRLRSLGDKHPVLRLELSKVQGFTPVGCNLLLESLRRLQARQCELIVVGAADLADQIRASVCVGRRDDTEAPWLLLLELLQLLNREKDFEETSMDYCVTFEVSPPAFVAPSKVDAKGSQHVSSASPDRFMLPPVIDGDYQPLLTAIAAYAEQYPTLVFDCSRLTRVGYGVASEMQARLQALADDGKKLELRDLNHLVAALLRLLGYGNFCRIYTHKY